MTEKITWPMLLDCYDACEFLEDSEGRLSVTSKDILNTLHILEKDENATAADFYTTQDINGIAVGDVVSVHVGKPALSLGVLANNLQGLLAAPDGYIEFPERFFLVDGRVSDRTNASTQLDSYRAVVEFVRVMQETAVFVDRSSQKLFYFKSEKIEVPVRYTAAALKSVDTAAIERILSQFASDTTHRAHKLTILADIIPEIVRIHPVGERFEFVLRNVDHIIDRLEEGYRLFVSSFSYDKIRSDLESANVDFTSKIHKTFVDIQGQLLGIPIATIVVASQMKVASSCGMESLTNFAVVMGAWIFAAFLLASIVNQWLTLNVIDSEVDRQKTRLTTDFAAISGRFLDVFDSLNKRIYWSRFFYFIIGAVGVAGAVFATFAYRTFTATSIWTCISK